MLRFSIVQRAQALERLPRTREVVAAVAQLHFLVTDTPEVERVGDANEF